MKAPIRVTAAVLQTAWLDAHERRLAANAPRWAVRRLVIIV
ncbi:MAG: hypothetical protein ABGZ23_01710 [Fuerstiella sp.]